jgi:hypothetical protein
MARVVLAVIAIGFVHMTVPAYAQGGKSAACRAFFPSLC